MLITKQIKKAGIVLAYLVAFWLLLPFLLWCIATYLDSGWNWTRIPSLSGWPFLVAGLAFMTWAMVLLRSQGKGLPISALPPQQLVQTGPYAWVRHPIYLGFHLALLGAALVTGSRAALLIVTPAFLPCWIMYALLEERSLKKRFGETYRHYQQWVGILPRLPIYRLVWLIARLRLQLRVEGKEHLPKGSFVLIANHSCYLDPAYLMASMFRPVRYLVTAQVYRNKLLRFLLNQGQMIPVRRYRVDPLANRRLLEWLGRGQIVGVFPEGERSPLGQYQGALPGAAKMLAHLQVSVIPAGIVGAYEAGPRWSDALRRRPITVRFGKPLEFSGDPKKVIDNAILELLNSYKPAVHINGLQLEKLSRVLWACPQCLSEKDWRPAAMTCLHCSARFENTPDGLFRDDQGKTYTLAELGQALLVHVAEAESLSDTAIGYYEADSYGVIKPLQQLSANTLTLSRKGISFAGLELPLETLRSVTTERADTLQVATSRSMWQFRPQTISVFRLKATLDCWLQNNPRSIPRDTLAKQPT
jgi:1-acyl-sn-glycerol-3-phosphate acyltransferase